MGTVVLAGATSGSTTLSPTDAVTTVITLPASTDTLVGKATTDTLTNKTLTSPSISGAVLTTMASSVITSATAQNSTSGTSINFTGIPSWVKRITVMYNVVSTNGTSNQLIQLGTSGGIEATGYSVVASYSTTSASFTTGFGLKSDLAAFAPTGTLILNLLSTNLWVGTGMFSMVTSGPVPIYVSGVKTLSGTLDRIRCTTSNGTDTFDAGSINIMYE